MNSIRRSLTLLGFLVAALGAPRFAHATGETCINDDDCKTDTACGGEVCDWTAGKICRAATAAGSGKEGWCTTSANCKCAAEGATCNGLAQCTKTVDTSAAGGSGGASASGGSSSSTAGATAAAGTTAAAGSSSSSSSDDSSGGCSISERAPKNSLSALLGAACAAALIGARRRRRAA